VPFANTKHSYCANIMAEDKDLNTIPESENIIEYITGKSR
jgi:hypothetical protein